jgi:hypothetical protein
VSSENKYPAIKYTSRDFNTIKRDLVNYAKRYYSNTYKDFSEAGFGSLMLDTVAYIGDILSFYVDYNVNESFLDTAIEYDNILRLGRQMGFQFRGAPTSYGMASFFIIVPASSLGDVPNPDYLPILKKGSQFSSVDGVKFSLNEDIDFGDPDNEVVIAQVDAASNVTSFAVKAQGPVISGETIQEKHTIGNFQPFRQVQLGAQDISEIISVIDSAGNEYYEVDYLSQDVVYKSVINRDSNKTKTTSAMRPFAVPRRFTTEMLENSTLLQFGFGSDNDINTDGIADPSKTILDVYGKDYITAASFDPSNLLRSDKMGVSPENTTLTITYRKNTIDTVNVSVGGLTNVDGPQFDFNDISSLAPSSLTTVVNSLEVNNEEAILGDISLPSTSELKERINNVFASQNRAVTALDYKSLCYSMPTRFGSIKRANVIKDPGSLKRNLNIYVLSEDNNGNFVKPNSTIKENLKQWLEQSRMINDTIDIVDGKVINIGIEFDVVSDLESNRFEILNNATTMLIEFLQKKFDIGEPFYYSQIYKQLNQVEGVVDTTNVKVVQKTGLNYSSNILFDIQENTSPDGRYIMVPDNAVLEIKYPTADIKGNIR